MVKKLTNFIYRRKYKIGKVDDAFDNHLLASYKELYHFCSEYLTNTVATRSGTTDDTWLCQKIVENIFHNLFSNHRELTVYQCVFAAFKKEIYKVDKDLLYKQYNELWVYSICVRLYEEYSEFMKNIKISTKSDISELFMKYIYHVGDCEGCIYLSDNDDHSSVFLTKEEKYYINTMFDKYVSKNKFEGIQT
jgi:hypothetical protein